jgi:hypothetical protein
MSEAPARHEHQRLSTVRTWRDHPIVAMTAIVSTGSAPGTDMRFRKFFLLAGTRRRAQVRAADDL